MLTRKIISHAHTRHVLFAHELMMLMLLRARHFASNKASARHDDGMRSRLDDSSAFRAPWRRFRPSCHCSENIVTSRGADIQSPPIRQARRYAISYEY